MKTQLIRRRIWSVVSICIVCVLCMAAAVKARAVESEDSLEAIESAEATTIQLMKTEGEASVLNAGGRNLSVMEKMRLYNGYRTKTEEASYAWINLDSEKLTKQDAVSETEIRKRGKKLEILLKSGNLFFDVTEPLEEEETLNIRTSTMVVGIRGTSGWVKVLDRWRSRVYILEGTVTCYVTDPVTGQIKSTTLSGGETAEFVVYNEEQSGERCDIIKEGFAEDDIDGFVLTELAGNDALCQKIEGASNLVLGDAVSRAGERLLADQESMKGVLDGIWEAYGNQENYISKDPVWVDGTGRTDTGDNGTLPERIRNQGGNDEGGGNSDTGTSSGSGTSFNGGGGSSNPGGSGTSGETVNTPPSVTLTEDTYPINVQSLQDLLNSPDVGEVVVDNNPDPPKIWVPNGTDGPLIAIDEPSEVNVNPGDNITIPAGKTLTLVEEVSLNVGEGATVTVDGTLNVGKDMDVKEGATVTINGTVNVKGRMTNSGTIIVTGSN